MFLNSALVLATAPAAGSLAAILADVTSIVTNTITQVGSWVTVITSNPLIEMFVILSVVGLGIGVISRLLHL